MEGGREEGRCGEWLGEERIESDRCPVCAGH